MVNVVFDALGRVFHGGQSGAARRHSAAVAEGRDASNGSGSSWGLLNSASPNRKAKKHLGSSNSAISTSSSYVLLEPIANGGGGDNLVVKNSVVEQRRGTCTGLLLTVPDTSPALQRRLPSEQQPASTSSHHHREGKSRSHSGSRAYRKQSIASTILSMITTPASTSLSTSAGRRHQQQQNFRQQRSFDLPRTRVDSPSDDEAEKKDSTASKSTRNQQQMRRQEQYRQQQQHSYSGVVPESVVVKIEHSDRCQTDQYIVRHFYDEPPNLSELQLTTDDAYQQWHRQPPEFMKNEEHVKIHCTPDTLDLYRKESASFMMNALGSNQQTILFGFCPTPTGCSSPKSFHRNDGGLERALSECSQIRSKQVSRGLLLRCINQDPMHMFVHYAAFNASPPQPTRSRSRSPSRSPPSSASPSHHQDRSQFRLNPATSKAFWRRLFKDLGQKAPLTNFGTYTELFSIQKTLNNDHHQQFLPPTRHSGYIVTCFKLLEDDSESHKQRSLEDSWMTWTGSHEINKYSPPSWSLRRITLYRQCLPPGLSGNGISNFAYVLVSEFGNILHPSNRLAAMDMCEKLRTRNCGHVALYQVQHSYSSTPHGAMLPGSVPSSTASSTTSADKLHLLEKGSAGMGMSRIEAFLQQPQGSPWSSPKVSSMAANERRKAMMARGYSCEDATYRRAAFGGTRADRSFGYDPSSFHYPMGLADDSHQEQQEEEAVLSSEEFLLMATQFKSTSPGSNNNNSNASVALNQGNRTSPPLNRFQTPPPLHPPPALSLGGFQLSQHHFHSSLSNV